MTVINCLVVFFALSAIVARSFCYFGMSRNVDTGEEVDSAADRAFQASRSLRGLFEDLQ
ncbi:hypothetical protein [Caballeronia sordidicola]|uniref:Uncharacterized protein n=1 Tax=Caballeronia sordidicola TaxID=196367 RepID=A0A242N730_CABSO|nr:hypothetical protein [Caballeronia sordidicola]OTP79451.1 hypothetical protein PAMC26577_00890 [Caballeronia sordidicola]